MTRRGFINAHFYGNDNSAVLVDEGHFLRFGSDAEIEKITGFDEIVDLGGMYVFPGFVDSHMHVAELGMYLNQIELKDCTSLEQISKKIQNNTHADTKWIVARGWREETIGKLPDKKFLDACSSNHPAVLLSADGHRMVVNTLCLQKANIHEDLNEADGRIDYKKGIVYEKAMKHITDVMPVPDENTIEKYILDGALAAARYGITTIASDDLASFGGEWRTVLDAFEKLSYQEKLPVRVIEQCAFTSPEEFAAFLDDGYTFDIGNDFFRIGPLKLDIDGSLDAHTALLTRPYLNDGDNCGMLVMNEDDIETFVQLAHRFNMPVLAKCTGDGAVDGILDIFKENTFEYYHGNPLHDGLIGMNVLRNDQIDKIRKYQLSCYIEPTQMENDAAALNNVDAVLKKDGDPWKALYDAVLTSSGTEAPVEWPDILRSVQYAVTRKTSSGRPFNSDQALSKEQAFSSYGESAYQQLFVSEQAGKIQEGYLADFIAVDQDLMHIDIEELDKAKIMMTVVNGKTVYEK